MNCTTFNEMQTSETEGDMGIVKNRDRLSYSRLDALKSHYSKAHQLEGHERLKRAIEDELRRSVSLYWDNDCWSGEDKNWFNMWFREDRARRPQTVVSGECI